MITINYNRRLEIFEVRSAAESELFHNLQF